MGRIDGWRLCAISLAAFAVVGSFRIDRGNREGGGNRIDAHFAEYEGTGGSWKWRGEGRLFWNELLFWGLGSFAAALVAGALAAVRGFGFKRDRLTMVLVIVVSLAVIVWHFDTRTLEAATRGL